MEGLDFDQSACMAAISHRAPISAIPANVQFLCEKKAFSKFQIKISKTEVLVCVYIYRHTNQVMAKSTQLITLIIRLYSLRLIENHLAPNQQISFIITSYIT